MLHRPLAPVFLLCSGDYVLWEWSLGSGHDTLALISGLSLPPLAIALAGLLVLNLARVLADTARRPGARHATTRRRGTRPGRPGRQPSDLIGESWKDEPVSSSSSSKLAA